MAEKMLTNWFTFLLYKFLKVTSNTLYGQCHHNNSDRNHQKKYDGIILMTLVLPYFQVNITLCDSVLTKF